MVVNDFTLLPIIGNGGGRPYVITNIENGSGRPYVITHYWEWWWTIFVITHYWEGWSTTLRYYPLLGMVVDDLTLLPIVGNGGEGPYFITYYWEGWWTTFFIIHYGEWCWMTLRYYPVWRMMYPVWRMMVNDLTLLPIIGKGGGRSSVITQY